MSLLFLASKRVLWMKTKIMLSFAIDDETVSKCLTDNFKRLESFFKDMDSLPKLFFYYQPRQFKKNELFMSVVGDGDKLEGKCVYFLRNSTKPIKDGTDQDQTVLFGELSAKLLETFEETLASVYSPLLASNTEWGQIKLEKDKQEFISKIVKFHEQLKRKIANLRGDVELKLPQPPHDKIEQKPAAYAKAAKDPEVLKHFQSIVTSWCEQITKYVENDESTLPIKKDVQTGPEKEIEYWSRRMLTLISITEQLKTKQSRVVTGVLKARALKNEGDENRGTDSGEQDAKAVIEHWREVDLAITDHLNEAKDNVRFLENLRKVIEPLYIESPQVIMEVMPSVLNSMKMIHTLSRHYGTEVRMTNLFERITNQLINRCKTVIYDGPATPPFNQLWKQDPADVISKMKASIGLCEEYQKQYLDTKAKLALMPKGKQFDFDEGLIFGKFTRFRRRLEKLIDMFSSIQQFKALEAKRIDGMEKLIASFEQLVTEFKLKNHDLLDFYNTVFERDFVEFTMHNSGLENAVQDFVERSLTQMASIDKQLELMKKFKEILHREALQEDLDQKYLMIFKLYGEDLNHIQTMYEKNKDNPPVPRNMTRCAGNIHWSRQLLRRITNPMKKFQDNPKVFHPKESKKIVKLYNKVARLLIEFETMWFQAWAKLTDQAKRGLRSKLAQIDERGDIHVNFDPGVLQVMREAKHLQLMGFKIPNSAQVILLLEDKLKGYYQRFTHALDVYHQNIRRINPVAQSLLKPHLADVDVVLRPAHTVMTWTSMNIESFLVNLHQVLQRFQFLTIQIEDIVQNRIEKNLHFVNSLLLVNLAETSCTLQVFQDEQATHIDRCTNALVAKNSEIERSVNDLLGVVSTYPISSPDIPPTDPLDVNFVKLHYCTRMYHSLLNSTKYSLVALKKRIKANPTDNKGPLFDVDVTLQVPKVGLSPNFNEIQEVVNAVARNIVQCTKKTSRLGYRCHRPSPFTQTIL